MTTQTTTRRLFCKCIALVPFVPLTMIELIGCASAPIYRGTFINGRIKIPYDELDQKDFKGKVFVVQASELEYPIIVVQQGEGRYHALSAECTHQGCQVRPSKNSLVCPCHGSTFDLEGQVIFGPAKAPLQPIAVEFTDNGIEIMLNQEKR